MWALICRILCWDPAPQEYLWERRSRKQSEQSWDKEELRFPKYWWSPQPQAVTVSSQGALHIPQCTKCRSIVKGPNEPDPAYKGETGLPTKCRNSAARLPLVDSSMFITFVCVPKMLNFLNLGRKGQKYLQGLKLLHEQRRQQNIVQNTLHTLWLYFFHSHLCKKKKNIYIYIKSHICI